MVVGWNNAVDLYEMVIDRVFNHDGDYRSVVFDHEKNDVMEAAGYLEEETDEVGLRVLSQVDAWRDTPGLDPSHLLERVGVDAEVDTMEKAMVLGYLAGRAMHYGPDTRSAQIRQAVEDRISQDQAGTYGFDNGSETQD